MIHPSFTLSKSRKRFWEEIVINDDINCTLNLSDNRNKIQKQANQNINMSRRFNISLSTNIVILGLVSMHICSAFNLSQKPNLVVREPITSPNARMPKMRSSYFGYSVNLKHNSVIIGAPRAQSTLEVQRRINETGAIYKCNLGKDDSCAPFIFDPWGNVHNEYNQYSYENEKKDYQWLGATMDSNANDNDKFVVCAPRLISDVTNHYLMHGVCYWTTNTSSVRPANVQKIAPLRFKDKQQNIIDKDRYFYYMYGEQGVSVHITENNEEILIGAPGIFTWKGSVIRHKAKPFEDLGGLSRRNEDPLSIPRHRPSPDNIEYSSDIPNPMYWNQDDNSYFGFAVSSGYFDGKTKTKLLYVASAPQANLQQGEVYIFDIVDHYASDKTIKIYQTFVGQQFGEYFGYALITDDYNNDGYTDIAISAPYNSKTGSYENGAVYIYKNAGSSSSFVLSTILRTEYEFSGRFGTTISKVGDINQDGFNDLIVAAPFEENGAIYVYLGSSSGLSNKPSQRITAPSSSTDLNQMFGHGLSKGVDIDGNQYLDIAVGSPNAEAVYIYKSYPVIRIITSIRPYSSEIQTTDQSFKFAVCWKYASNFPINFDVHFNATVKLDGQLGRAIFNNKRNEYEIKSKVNAEEECMQLTAFVTFSIADIFKPIELEMIHNILNGIPDSNDTAVETEDFCETCVALNPNDSKNVKNKVVFSTGCKSARCVADLKVQSSLENILSLPYILGSTSTLLINYNIENNGEAAYLAQMKITLPDSGTLFTKIPSNCKLDDSAVNFNIMQCDLNNGRPMLKGDKTTLRIGIDTTKLDGKELIVKAYAHSAGNELNESDNQVENILPLGEFSEIEVFGDSPSNRLTLLNENQFENITHIFEIRNNGPSNVKSLDVFISLPISYINPITLERESLIDISSVSMTSVYKNLPMNIEWTQNNTILVLDAVESTTTASPNVPVEDYNGMQFDASRIGLEYDLNGGNQNNEDSMGERKRRALGDEYSYFNPYLQKVIKVGQPETLTSGRYKRDIFNTNDRLLNNLPVNRTIYFDCQDAEEELCLQGKFSVSNFKMDNTPILIALNFTVDMKKVANILAEKRDILVVRSSAELMRTFDEDRSTLKIVQNQPFTIISKYVISTTPLWVYIVSIIFGLLTLILISYAMHRLGFFKRNKRDELVRLKRQSKALSYYPKEDDDQY